MKQLTRSEEQFGIVVWIMILIPFYGVSLGIGIGLAVRVFMVFAGL